MRLYALAGNRHGALAQYRRCRECLRKEVDVEPEPATVKLYERIVAGELRRHGSTATATR